MVTIGTVLVIDLAMWPAGWDSETITSTGSPTSSAVAVARLSYRFPAERHSMVMFSPGMRPRSLRPAIRSGISQAPHVSSPILGRFAADWATADVGEPS